MRDHVTDMHFGNGVTCLTRQYTRIKILSKQTMASSNRGEENFSLFQTTLTPEKEKSPGISAIVISTTFIFCITIAPNYKTTFDFGITFPLALESPPTRPPWIKKLTLWLTANNCKYIYIFFLNILPSKKVSFFFRGGRLCNVYCSLGRSMLCIIFILLQNSAGLSYITVLLRWCW